MKNKESEYVTETIKKRPVNKKKVVKKIFSTIFLAILFGIVATMTALFVYPKLKERFYPDDIKRVVSLWIASDDAEEEEISKTQAEEISDSELSDSDEASENLEVVDVQVPEKETADVEEKENEDENDTASESTDSEGGQDNPSDDTAQSNDDSDADDDKPDTPQEDADDNTGKDNIDATSDEGSSGNGADNIESENDVVLDQVHEDIVRDIEIDDYKALMGKIANIAENAKKSLVIVSGKSSDTDWFNNSYESHNSSIGLIVADNGKELLIISPKDILREASYVDVTFDDGKTYRATVRKSDNNTGLCVVAVQLSYLPKETLEKIEYAQFGSLTSATNGSPIVAVGSPFGANGSSALGQVTSTSTIVDKTDSNVRLITTDIYGSTKASGVLVNFNGRIVGIICHENAMSDMPNLIHAYAVSDITQAIEKISNGNAIASLGIVGTDVTKEANEQYNVPFGAYVKKVVSDTPAMGVGIRNGDVITMIDDRVINSFEEYKKYLLEYKPEEVIKVTLMRPSGEDYTMVTYETTLMTN